MSVDRDDRDARVDETSREFIREKIVRPPLSLRQVALRTAFFVCLAVIFGVVSAFTFAAVRPRAEALINPTEPETVPPVEFTMDEPESTISEEESRAEETKAAREEAQRIEDAVSRAMEGYNFTPESLKSFYTVMQEACDAADRSIVSVTTGTEETDIFGNPLENARSCAGILIARTEKDVLAMTCSGIVDSADFIRVTFAGGETVPATLRQSDSITGISVVAVSLEALSEKTAEALQPILLGNSYTIHRGDLLIAVGAPAGRVHSTAIGSVALVEDNVTLTDMTGRMFRVSLSGTPASGIFLVNTAGEMVGWAAADGETEPGILNVLGISRFKPLLEKLSNGQTLPYFGASFQDVSASMHEAGLPAGVYVLNVAAGGPAYDAGIQNGDIIVGFGDDVTSSRSYLEELIERTEAGTVVPVKVLRAGREGYTELSYEVTMRQR